MNETAATDTRVADAATYAAQNLRRNLNKIIAEAQETLARMDAGQRPSYTMSGSIFGQTATDVEADAQRFAALLDLGMLSQDEAVAALQSKSRF